MHSVLVRTEIRRLILAASLALSFAATAARAQDARPHDGDLAAWEAYIAAHPDDLRAGGLYRQHIIAAQAYDRAIDFYKKLLKKHPRSQNAHVNCALAYVDKIPPAKAIAQPFLGKHAIGHLGKALEIGPSWTASYIRGLIYLYYKKWMGVAGKGVADLTRALAMQKNEPRRDYHVKTFIALGDGYWRLDEIDRARAVWSEGLAQFPGDAALTERLAKEGDELKRVVLHALDADIRIDTSLAELEPASVPAASVSPVAEPTGQP